MGVCNQTIPSSKKKDIKNDINSQYQNINKIDIKKDINSQYIFEQIFSFLDNRKIKELIIYNKKLQKFFGIGIIDYKNESGKYKKEENGKGCEYTIGTNNLLFEGEYKNGKKNGQGKEYYISGKLKFKGEYLNGKKMSGKGYDEYDNIYLEIENNGEGKEYYDNNKLKFEGIYLHGKRWKGIVYDYNGNKLYEIKYGKGKVKDFILTRRLKYLNEKKCKKRKIKFIEVENKNEDVVLNGKITRKGKEYNDSDELIFEGEYLNGERSGKGKKYYAYCGIKFEGTYLNGKKWNGILYGYNRCISIIIKNGKGKGKNYDFYGKLKFDGEYLNGERNGYGKEYDKEGELIFEGEYKNGFWWNGYYYGNGFDSIYSKRKIIDGQI